MVVLGGPLRYTNSLVRRQGKYDQAEPLFRRAQEIEEKSLGRDYPNIAMYLNNRALLLQKQVRAHGTFLGKSQGPCCR